MMGIDRLRPELLAGAWAIGLVSATPAAAQGAAAVPSPGAAAETQANQTDAPAPDAAVGDIVVTAQKRSESINSVPLSIVAATGDQLVRQGISNPGDLVKIVPGFQFTQTLTATPVYTLRGIGFYDSSFSATSTVAIYVDEVPLPFVITTTGASLDLERVEVVKGPQGTLFGQNATGGAINYIAAKPTADFHAGFEASYGRFNDVEGTGFISGPLTDTLRARVAVKVVQDGDWQRSVSRPGDTLGSRDEIDGRLLLDWKPLNGVSFLLNVNGWRDRSDMPAAQYIGLTPNIPAQTPPALAAVPFAPNNARAADWTPGPDYQRDARFRQVSLRGEIELTPDVSFTSLTSFQRYREDRVQDIDGTAVQNIAYNTNGNIRDFSQEVRLNGDIGRLKWILGGNYESSRVFEQTYQFVTQSSINNTFVPFGVTLPYLGNSYSVDQRYKTKGVFGNVDFEVVDRLTLHGGVRYTKLDGHAVACVIDDGNGALAQGLTTIYSFIRSQIGLPPVTAGLNDCLNASELFEPETARPELHEHNIAWRAGVDFAPRPGALIYANISRGYKGGSFPTLNSTTSAQFNPAKQESLQSYEAGFKLSVLNRRVQINGAGFYYDYSDKQFRGRVNDPIFGPAERELNIPRSRVVGAELQTTVRAAQGLDLSLGVTYLNTRVLKDDGRDFITFDSFGAYGSITGQHFPYTPKWQGAGSVDYSRPIADGRYNLFLGANARYQTRTQTAFNNTVSLASTAALLTIKDYGVLDLRAGIENPTAGWRLSVFGRNVTNTYYWTNAIKSLDTTIRYAGRPATYGVSFSYRM